jgi:two-component system, NtrC family, sensor kinase
MAQEEMTDAEARLRSVLESAPNAILTADRDGRIQFLNRGAHYRVEDVVGKNIYDLLPSDDVARVRACVANVLRTGEVASYEIRYPRRSGMPAAGRSFRVNVGPVRSSDAITGVTLISWDVTDQLELQARLMAADRLASVGLLAAGVAHEVNNPLMYALVHLRWALDRIAAGTDDAAAREVRERIEFALDGLERIGTIIRDLRSVADDSEVSVAVEINRVLDASLRVTQHWVETRARIVRDYAELPPVRVSESKLGQVFVNLIVNAAQSMEGGVDDNELRLSTRVSDDGHVVVDIVDTGTGVPPDLVEHVFEPFVTTKSPGVGTGLGLFVCARLAQEMDARIAIVATDPSGTTVRVTVPVAAHP